MSSPEIPNENEFLRIQGIVDNSEVIEELPNFSCAVFKIYSYYSHSLKLKLGETLCTNALECFLGTQ